MRLAHVAVYANEPPAYPTDVGPVTFTHLVTPRCDTCRLNAEAGLVLGATAKVQTTGFKDVRSGKGTPHVAPVHDGITTPPNVQI